MQPDIWEEWWRPACVLDMQPDMWSMRCRRACVRSHAKRHTGCHQPEAYWLLSPINTPQLQLISSHPDLSKLSQSVPLMIKWRCCPELVQIHGFRSVEVLLDTPPGSPKNCPEAKGGVLRVIYGTGLSLVPVIFKDSVVAGGRTIWITGIFGHIGRSPSCDVGTAGAKPAHARHVLWWTSVSSASYSAGSRKPLILWIGKTQRDEIMAYG
ncbi:hypothetical protein YC2023_012303 [Brassica napus]